MERAAVSHKQYEFWNVWKIAESGEIRYNLLLWRYLPWSKTMTHNNQLLQLKEKIDEHFSAEDFRELVFDLGIDFGNIPGNAKKERIIELVIRLKRNGRIPQLIIVTPIVKTTKSRI